jgi:hypothetical protein
MSETRGDFSVVLTFRDFPGEVGESCRATGFAQQRKGILCRHLVQANGRQRKKEIYFEISIL